MGPRPRPRAGAAAPGLSTLSGWLAIDKPPGLPTRALANVVTALLHRRVSVGHVGTLDPAAAGVVLLALGRASKLVPFLVGTKRYDALVKLGLSTASDDATGRVTAAACAAHVTPAAVHAAVGSFHGVFPQLPPAYSAKRVGGERAYQRVRAAQAAGVAAGDDTAAYVGLQPRAVTLHDLSLRGGGRWCSELVSGGSGGGGAAPRFAWLRPPRAEGTTAPAPQSPSSPYVQWDAQAAPAGVLRMETAPPPPPHLLGAAAPPPLPAAGASTACSYPELQLSIECGAGFYVRSLARDLGARLGVPATLAALTRTASNGVALADATPFYALAGRHSIAMAPALRPVDAPFVAGLPAVLLRPVCLRTAKRVSPSTQAALLAAVETVRVAMTDEGGGGAPTGAAATDSGGELSEGSGRGPAGWVEAGGVAPQRDARSGATGSGGEVDPRVAAPPPAAARPLSAWEPAPGQGTSTRHLLLTKGELEATFALWSCDSTVAFEGTPLPHHAPASPRGGSGSVAVVREEVGDSKEGEAGAAASSACGAHAAGPPPPTLVRVYALAARGDLEAVTGGTVMNVACPAARAAAASTAQQAGTAVPRGGHSDPPAAPFFCGLAWTLTPRQARAARSPSVYAAAAAAAGAVGEQHSGSGTVRMVRVVTMLA